MGGKIPPNSLIIEKKASADNIADIFTRTDIHPMVYFLVLTRQYTAQWMTWESAALVKIIETDFNLTEGIEDIALNKILSIQVANRSDAVYTQHHAFEKVIRAFNDRPIDFFDREINDMTMEDLAFGLLTLQQVTPHDDIFELFSQNVWNHMIDILLADENKIFYPVALIEDKEGNGEKFIEKLNEILLDGANAQDTKNVNDMAIASKAIQENELICRIGLELLTKLRGMKTDYNTIDDEKFISVMLDKINIPLEDRIKEIIKKHILKNIEMDIFLEGQQLRLKRQSNEFQL
jgi:translation elongation factor EF-1beta